MSLRDLLEPFTETGPNTAEIAVEAIDVEAIRSSAYESGYASGWEDAKQAELAARQHVGAEFERNVQNLSFTYHEAVDRVRGELTEFITTFLDVFLPAATPGLLKENIRTELISLSDICLDGHVELVVAPDCQTLVEEMLTGIDLALDVHILVDPDLATHQVFVRIADLEREIDFAPVLDSLTQQLAALTGDEEEDQSHGWK